MIRSLAIWRALESDLGADVGFTQGGSLYLATDAAQLDTFRPWLAIAREHDLDTRLLNSRELANVLRERQRTLGGWHAHGERRARGAESRGAGDCTRCGRCRRCDPDELCGARHRTRRRSRPFDCHRARCRPDTHRRFAPAAPGRISSAVRSISRFRSFSSKARWRALRRRPRYSRVKPGRTMSRSVGDETAGTQRRVARRWNMRSLPTTFRYMRKFWPAMRQEQGAIRLRLGRDFLRAATTPSHWDLAAESRPSSVNECSIRRRCRRDLRALADAIARRFPEIASAAVVESWAGMIETSPDVLPIISAVERIEGFFVATGFSGHGFGIGPGAGELVARMATKRASSEELAPFRLGRFYDGSPIRPGPTI